MIISLCGNNKEDIIKELKKVYDVMIFDYIDLKFQMVIKYEKVYYDLLDNASKREMPKEINKEFMDEIMNSIKEKREEFSAYIDNKIFNKVNELHNNNRGKIILITGNNECLSYDICQTPIFKKADLRILLVSEKEELDLSNINRDDFNYIISSNKNLDVKELIKI